MSFVVRNCSEQLLIESKPGPERRKNAKVWENTSVLHRLLVQMNKSTAFEKDHLILVLL